MGTIFQQILDSESIFKAKGNEIANKKEKILEFKKQIEKQITHTESVILSNVDLRAKIENQAAHKELLLHKEKILKAQHKEMKEKVDAIKIESNNTLLCYKKSRDDLIKLFSFHSNDIIAANSSLKQVDSRNYDVFCRNRLELETLEQNTNDLRNQLSVKKDELKKMDSSVILMKSKVSSANCAVNDLKKELEMIGLSSIQTNHIRNIKLSITNYENEIASMVSEITNKRQYIKNFTNPTLHIHNAVPRQSAHFYKPQLSRTNTQSKYGLSNLNHPYQHQQPNLIPAPSSSKTTLERMVVTGPPVPSSTPEEEEDLFDDHVISEEVLRACDEAQQSRIV